MPRITDSSFEDDSEDEQVVEHLPKLKNSTELFSSAFDGKITAVVDVDNFYCVVSAEKPILDRIQQMLKEEVRGFAMMRNPISGSLWNYL
jgi:hypothetical protein